MFIENKKHTIVFNEKNKHTIMFDEKKKHTIMCIENNKHTIIYIQQKKHRDAAYPAKYVKGLMTGVIGILFASSTFLRKASPLLM